MSLALENIFLITMIIAWTLGGVGAIFFRKRTIIAHYFPYVTAIVGSVSVVLASVFIFLKQDLFTYDLWTVSMHFKFTFATDPLAAFFLFIIGFIAFAVSLYAPRYVKAYKEERNLQVVGALLNFFLLSLIGVILADNSFTFLILWEMMSVLSFFLVIVEHEKYDVLHSGRLYVIMTHLATGFLFFVFLIFYSYTGSLDFAVFRSAGESLPVHSQSIIFVLALLGFGTKAGLVPVHIWLPRAHPVAPSHISTLMSAVMIKTALYGMIRIVYEFLGTPYLWWGVIFLLVGMFTAIYGILYGVVQKDIKRFLAYSSVENMGLVFIGLGASLIFYALDIQALAGLALLAALYHALNHSFFKGLLFMGAGAVYRATGTKNMEELGGLIRYMPQTAALFLVGALAIASFPPMNGFISKWLTFQSLFQLSFLAEGKVGLTLLGALAATVLIFVGAVVALGFVKLFGIVFLAQPRSEKVKKAKEAPLPMRLSMGLLGLGALLLGIFPSFVLNQLNKVTGRYFTGKAFSGSELFNLQSVAGHTISLSPMTLVIVFLIILGLTLLGLFLWVGKSKNRTTEPWACGVTLKPNMSYSGLSFSHPVLLIFKRLFGESGQVMIKEQKIYFALVLRKIFDRLIYQPLVRLVVFISNSVRKIQDGSIHSYLAYIFVSLIVLLLLVTID